MTQENIFQTQTTETKEQTQNVSKENPFADLLGTIKNERGEPKYKDLNTALDALKHSQEFIPQLKSDKERVEKELEDARKEIERLKAVEDSVTRLTSGQSPQTTQTSQGLDAEAVANLVTQTLQRRETESTQKANLSSVVNTLQQAFGQDAEKNFYSKANELGISVEEMNTLAAKSPKAVYDLFGLSSKNTSTSGKLPQTSPSINTAGYQPQKESFVGRNIKPVILGASTEELNQERANAATLVEELHSQGLSTYDLTDPKVYFKHFGKK